MVTISLFWRLPGCRMCRLVWRRRRDMWVSPYYEYNVKATDSFNSSLPWNQVYKVIRQTNNLIAATESGLIKTTDEAALNEIKAQAWPWEACFYTILYACLPCLIRYDNAPVIRVPIVTTATDQSSKPARNDGGRMLRPDYYRPDQLAGRP